MLRKRPVVVYIGAIILLLLAFAGAVGYVRVCDE